MSLNSGLTTAEIKTLLAGEIEAADGTMSDCFDDGARLFARSILPWVSEVRPQDRVQGGVALRATEGEVWVHPYVFRLICRNGQIMAQTLQSTQIVFSDTFSNEHASELIRQAVRACAEKDAFSAQAEKMRLMPRSPVDYMLTMLPLLAMLSPDFRTRLLLDIGQRFESGNDRSLYGVLNAVTSLARDTQEPDLRWRLEELGGAVLNGQPLKSRGPRRAVRELVGV